MFNSTRIGTQWHLILVSNVIVNVIVIWTYTFLTMTWIQEALVSVNNANAYNKRTVFLI